jgi:hypothetical protein
MKLKDALDVFLSGQSFNPINHGADNNGDKHQRNNLNQSKSAIGRYPSVQAFQGYAVAPVPNKVWDYTLPNP